jgi:cullin 1
LITTCETVLVKDHTALVQDEFQPLLNADKNEDLMRMYALLARVPESLEKLRNLFEAHVKNQGLASVEKVLENNNPTGGGEAAGGADDEEEAPGPKKKKGSSASDVDPKVYVESLLIVHKKYFAMVNSCFAGEPGFVASMDKAVREFVNRNAVCKDSSSKSPELLAKFCDSLLRKSSKISEEGEVEELLNSVVRINSWLLSSNQTTHLK